MATARTIRQNLYFLIPFLMWCLFGGALLALVGAESIFFWVNQHNSTGADFVFSSLTFLGEFFGILTVGIILMTCVRSFRNLTFFLSVLLGTVISSLVAQLIKYIVAAPRPMQVFEGRSGIHRLDDWPLLYQNSFPSGHTTGAFAFMAVVAYCLPQRYNAWGLLCFCAAMLTAYSRVYLTAHFFADVYAGSIIGTGISLSVCAVIPNLTSRFQKQ